MPDKADELGQGRDQGETLWVMSNRKDDRVVLYEQDALHPGGEAFIGGAGVDEVARTPKIDGLLRQGLIVEVPEPPQQINGQANRKRPIAVADRTDGPQAAQPGQPIPLGRALDPELLGDDGVRAVQRHQAQLPAEVPAPAGAIVPDLPEQERAPQRGNRPRA